MVSEVRHRTTSAPVYPFQTPLFFYPSSYGEHKYGIPTLRSFCNSPVFFSDYWEVLKEIQEICRNSTAIGSASLKYTQTNADTFGGNFSFENRFSYFDHREDGREIPCGFFKRFPISNSDQTAMEKCDGLVVVSAIFNDHDKIRQPKGLGSKTLDCVCFFMFVDDVTLKGLNHYNLISSKSKEYKIGAWRVIKVSSKLLYENAAMNGAIPKYLIHRLFPNSRHPFYIHTMEEAMATARWKKWLDVDALKMQMETYCEHGLQPWTPTKSYPTDVPDSALILRKHSMVTNLFSCLLFNELEAFNPRDQLPFAFVRDHMSPGMNLNMFDVEVFEQVAVEYRHNLKPGGANVGPKVKKANSDLLANGSFSKCEKYLSNMWG
ncbi:unnamed protein product [Fraxinus pennsylvanica]|uniref:TOD1/MUCI70 glycosyltransferase-like domain-containing protein n=1 Tax=Fraxinus pennsylvanica TaxID=56036 RepID=A0AAD2DZ95_9LAMI|nr:unnamed protein product [Fraxinus pennsylvanica]